MAIGKPGLPAVLVVLFRPAFQKVLGRGPQRWARVITLGVREGCRGGGTFWPSRNRQKHSG